MEVDPMLDPGFPETLPEFEATFGDEDACLEYLKSKKWPRGFRCPRCEHDRSYTIRIRRVEQCARCRHQTSLTAGTMFHKTRKPLTLWFRAIFEFVSRKHGCNAMDLQRLLGLARKTAWSWLHKIRECMVTPNRSMLSGEVQVDESYVGGPEEGTLGRDRGSKKILLVGAVEEREEGCGRARLAPVPSAGAHDLQCWIVDVVQEWAAVCTDGLASYEGLDECYEHQVQVIGDPKTASKKFPQIHRVFSLFKRLYLGIYHGSMSEKYAPLYCEEFTFRFNRRNSKCRTLLVQRVLENAVHQAPRIHLYAGKEGLVPRVAA